MSISTLLHTLYSLYNVINNQMHQYNFDLTGVSDPQWKVKVYSFTQTYRFASQDMY